MKRQKQTEKRGFALLLALIISSIVLAIGVSILHVSINQINLSATARESELAFQAAHAGIDCQWYWRNELPNVYITSASSPSNPSIACFGQSPLETSATRISTVANAGTVDVFFNQFQWGDPTRCTVSAMYIFNASGGTNNLTAQFENEGIGEDGLKTCNAGNVCTVLVSDGYNRSCAELGSAIFSVQREIVVEF